jgi:hypothetical protein
LIWPVSGTTPGCAGADGSAACATAIKSGATVASAAAAMNMRPVMTNLLWLVSKKQPPKARFRCRHAAL